MTTTLSISKAARKAGESLAKADRRSLSGQIEILILEEAKRRGLDFSRRTSAATETAARRTAKRKARAA